MLERSDGTVGSLPFAFGKIRKKTAGPLTGQLRSRAHAARTAWPRLGFHVGERG